MKSTNSHRIKTAGVPATGRRCVGINGAHACRRAAQADFHMFLIGQFISSFVPATRCSHRAKLRRIKPGNRRHVGGRTQKFFDALRKTP
ncbi:MAG TPA: hypothetical protein VL051_11395 [Burkholderiaceae bacterium]|nr:hypothetical protein [Burkholderiaceae bacterium]